MEDTPGWQKHKPNRTGHFMSRLPGDFPSSKPQLSLRQKFIRWRALTWPKLIGPIYSLFASPRPYYHGFMLLWPFPWRFRVPPQLPVEELIGNEDLLMQRKTSIADYTALRKIPLFRARDTPLRCIYRLHEAVCAMSRNELVEESQYYFHDQSQWKLKDIPDPKDPDPKRQAILASLVETLVQSFNFKIGMGLRRGITDKQPWLIERFQRENDPPYEETPEWTSLVDPLPEVLKMDPALLVAPKYFFKRNILVVVDSLWNF